MPADPTPAAPDQAEGPQPMLPIVGNGDMPLDWWAIYDEATKHFVASGPHRAELAGFASSSTDMVRQIREYAKLGAPTPYDSVLDREIL